MRLCLTSDLHGYVPEILDCDILLIAGDLIYDHRDYNWYFHTFKPWIDKLSERMWIVGIAGNHDLMFEKRPDLIPYMNWTYLQDSSVIINDISIYGTPWQPRFFDWAFNLDEPELEKKWEQIPKCDILLSHGPPYLCGDFSDYGLINCGSHSLRKKIEELQPKLVVYGHIHSGYGSYQIGETLCINASHVNDRYQPVNKPILVEIDENSNYRIL